MNKIEALRETAKRVLTRHYDWVNSAACNCGHLAQVVMGLNRTQLTRKLGSDQSTTYENRVRDLMCRVTNKPMIKVIQALIDFGFTAKEIMHLEDLDDPAIIGRAKKHFHYKTPAHVADYLNAWADMLEEAEPKADFVLPTPQPITYAEPVTTLPVKQEAAR